MIKTGAVKVKIDLNNETKMDFVESVVSVLLWYQSR